MLAGLQAVDYVTVFDEETPLGLIEASSRRAGQGSRLPQGRVVGADFVEAYGGRVYLRLSAKATRQPASCNNSAPPDEVRGKACESFNPEPAATANPHRRRWLRVKQPWRPHCMP